MIENFEQNIKNVLDNYTVNTQPQGWDIVSKGLKAHKQKIFMKKVVFISALIFIVAGLFYFAKNNFTNKSQNKTVQTQTIVDNINNNNQKQATKQLIIKNDQTEQVNKTLNTESQTNIKNKEQKQEINKTIELTQDKDKLNSDTDIQDTQTIEPKNKLVNNIILPNADFIVDYKKGCQPLNVKFLPAEKSDSMIYYWNFGDGTSNNEQSPSHTYTQPGKFTVSLTVKYYRTGKIISKSYRDLIKVYSLPKSDFDFTNQGSKYYFTNKSINSKTHIWLGFDGKIITEESPKYDFSKNKTYTISLVSINKNGCSDTLTKQITVNSIEQITLFMPNAFTPDGDGINDYFGVTQPLEYKEFYMQIFDLQGNLLYLSNDKQKMWDGKNKQNKPVSSGKYIWKVLIKTQKGNEIQKLGYLNLIK
ncbi:MAG: hypothetical protein DRI94_12265 [Bacteroidetes bacterium]|nr:MAG: hypothetical protein DRI94_12265 [Bacteroidota bacterium]